MPGWGGRRAQAFTAAVLAHYGDTCHLCGHGGADSADHLVPLIEGGAPFDLDNARPAHYRACPTCGRSCNSVRGARSVASQRTTVDAVSYVD